MAQLFIIRHGETTWNKEKRLQGRMDSPLSNMGKLQTELLAGALKGIEFQKVYCSPLGRTRDTVEILLNRNKSIEYIPALQEINLGQMEGRRHEELSGELLVQHSYFWEQPDQFRLPRGESFYDVQSRVVDFFREINHTAEKILVVTHTVVIRVFINWMLKRPMDQIWQGPFLYPTSLTTVQWDGNAFRLQRLANIDHLRNSV